MVYQVIGETAMILHFAFLIYVTLGGFLTWRWPRTFWLHVPFAAYSLSINLIGWECPSPTSRTGGASTPVRTVWAMWVSSTTTSPAPSILRNTPSPHNSSRE